MSSNDLTGQLLGDYQILRRLGRGGMAEVYLARQQSLRRNVALKILKPDLAGDRSYIERFQREAQSAALLVQANIVQIYEVGEIDGLHFIAQEYVLGRNLREYIARNGAAKPVMAINVLRQVALALKKADEHRVIHRDIKPENIMLTPSGEVKVTDFGLARINDDSDKHLTQIGMTMGTPLYMSPEQVEGAPVDVRSDIYSLGVTAYHMLAGKPPFDGETALSIAVQHVKNKAESLSEMRPDVPIEMIKLIERMMCKSPDDRPQSAGELLKEIKAIKVDAEENWDQLVETLAIETSTTIPMAHYDNPRLAATRQLQAVMKENIRSWWTSSSTIVTFFLLAIFGTLIGAFLAREMPVQDPISRSQDDNSVPRQASAKEQYEYALRLFPFQSDPRYFGAVIDYFDVGEEVDRTEQIWINRARERQAEIFLDNEQYESAREIYEFFAKSDSVERQYVVGIAGLAIIHHALGESSQEKEKVQTLLGIKPKLEEELNQFMMRRIEPILTLNSSQAAYIR